jgi:hypothetical protein
VPRDERPGDERCDDRREKRGRKLRAPPSPPFRANESPRQRTTRHQPSHTEHGELPPEIEHCPWGKQRNTTSDRKGRPRRRVALDEPADGGHAQHHGGPHRGRGCADYRNVDRDKRHRRDRGPSRRQPRRPAQQLDGQGDDGDVQPGDGEHMHQPGRGITIADGRIE